MSKIKVNRLENTSTANGGIDIDSSGHVQVDGLQMPTAGALNNRNLLFNGAMDVDQRNVGASMNATTAAEYCLDRWRTVSSASDKWSVKRVNRTDVTPPEGFSNSMKITSLAATTVTTNDYYILQQRLEGNTLPGYANSQTPITISFWVRSSLTGTYGGSWQNTGYVQYYPFQFTINSANTWEYKTITIPGSGNNYIDGNSRSAIFTIGLGIGTGYSQPASGGWTSTIAFGADNSVDFVSTSGATMYLTGVQAEVGENATDFEFKPFAEELALCYRYFYRKKTFNAKSIWFYSTTAGSCQIDFPTEMRARPSIDVVSASNAYQLRRNNGFDNVDDFVLDGNVSLTGTAIQNNTDASGTAGQAGHLFTNSSSGFLAFDAEL